MEQDYELPPSRVGEKLTYTNFIAHTIFPDGRLKDYKKEESQSKKPTELVKEVLNWRKETNNY